MDALDHVVVVVSSLADSVTAFTAAGFTVTPDGKHDALPTENALISLVDGTYLELLAARDPNTREEWRQRSTEPAWERHLHGVSAIARRFLPTLAGADGVADWSLCTGALGARATSLRRAGHAAAGPVPMSRERREGEKLAWELLLPESRLLPFWIADRTPRERRVPGTPEATTHANGARGVERVRVRAKSVPVAALAMADVLGVMPRANVDGSATFGMKGWRLELEEGTPEGACAVNLRGCAELPTRLDDLGVRAERFE